MTPRPGCCARSDELRTNFVPLRSSQALEIHNDELLKCLVERMTDGRGGRA